MAQGRLKILIALADRPRAEELAAWLAEHDGMLTLLREDVVDRNTADDLDVLVTDEPSTGRAIPTVLLSAEPPSQGEALAVLPPSAPGSLVAAAACLVSAGYRILPYRAAPPHRGHDLSLASLTQREREVIALLAEGASNKLIARRLDISVHTAKFHVAAILDKLGAVNRTDAIAIAMREGLVLL